RPSAEKPPGRVKPVPPAFVSCSRHQRGQLMMIVMKRTATQGEIQAVIDRIQSVGARAHPSRGEEVTVIGAIGDREHIGRLQLEGGPGGRGGVPILKPYKLASAQVRQGQRTVLDIGGR